MSSGKFSKHDVVKCLGTKIFEKAMLQAAHPNDWRTVVLTGRVHGKGEGRKTWVWWELGDRTQRGDVGARVLELVQGAGDAGAPVSAPSPNAQSEGDSVGSSDSDMDISESGDQVPLDDEPADPDDAPADNALTPGGLCWIPEPDGIGLCARETSGSAGHFLPKLKWPRDHSGLDQERTPFDYWLFLMPDMLAEIVKWTNVALPERARRATKHEVVKFFGIQYCMTLYPSRQRKNYWSTADTDLFPAPNFGSRFGMSRTRFAELVKYLRMHDPALDDEDDPDPWRQVRTFVDEFNKNRAERVIPGWILVVDESTSKWRGLGDWYDLGMPHITKIPRKPEPVGLEIKDMCDGESGIMLYLEMMEGQAVMRTKKFEGAGMKAGTAHCLRCTEPWHGSGRVLVGDSAFASVQTCIQLMKWGIFFVGLLKTASTMYPKRHLQTMPMAERGDTATFTATKDRVTMIAHVWNDPGKEGKPRKSLISTFGTTLPAEPVRRPRKRKRADGTWEDWFREVKRTELVSTYFTYAGAIDRHNRVRMDGVRMERTLEFKSWHNRVISSVLGIIATDAFYAMRMEQGDLELDVFMEKLASEMIFNQLPGRPDQDPDRPRRAAAEEPPGDELGSMLLGAINAAERGVSRPEATNQVCHHNILMIKDLPKYKDKSKATLTCVVCKAQTANFYCSDCSRGVHGKIVAVCGLATGKQCTPIHCAT